MRLLVNTFNTHVKYIIFLKIMFILYIDSKKVHSMYLIFITFYLAKILSRYKYLN